MTHVARGSVYDSVLPGIHRQLHLYQRGLALISDVIYQDTPAHLQGCYEGAMKKLRLFELPSRFKKKVAVCAGVGVNARSGTSQVAGGALGTYESTILTWHMPLAPPPRPTTAQEPHASRNPIEVASLSPSRRRASRRRDRGFNVCTDL